MSAEITLRFVSSHKSSLMGRAIDWFTQGRVGHVDAVLPDGSLLGSQATEYGEIPAGVQIRPANYWDFDRVYLVRIPVSEAQLAGWNGFMQRQIEKPYDYAAIAAFPVQRDWRNDDAWFCSELQAAALEEIGFWPYPLAAPVNKITPQALLLLCSASGVVEAVKED